RLSAQPLPTSPYPQTTATLPPISTSVARLMPSIRECRQPYLLSNLDLVTESLTLMAGNSGAPPPAFSSSAPLCTNKVASPPSSRIMFGPCSPGQVSASSAHRQYSSSD